MAHEKKIFKKHREHHPRVSTGLFLILLGVALLVATNDLFDLGGVKEYFTWQTAMIFVGVLLILNLNYIGGILLTAGGVWFWIDDRYGYMPELVRTIYWPVVIMVLGVILIISSFLKRTGSINTKTD